MKAVILAGGYGSRISEETHLKPKPMIEIGKQPILWHILKLYSHFGIQDFIICAGYKGYLIKEYFANYFLHTSDVTFDLKHNRMSLHRKDGEPWQITVVDTGEETQTGGRLKRVESYLKGETFCFTYGDGLGDIPLNELIAFHRSQGVTATLTAVQPPGRYGMLKLSADHEKVMDFTEKPEGDGAWISGGFFVLEPEIFSWLRGDETSWERDVLGQLAHQGELATYCHRGFWQAMDTLRDKKVLEDLWISGKAPWKIWDQVQI